MPRRVDAGHFQRLGVDVDRVDLRVGSSVGQGNRNTAAAGADVDDLDLGSWILDLRSPFAFPRSAPSPRSGHGGSCVPVFPLLQLLKDDLHEHLRLRPGDHHPLVDGEGQPHELTLPHDIRNRATRGAPAQNTLKPAPCVLGDWAVPSRVKCRAVQLQDVPEEYLGLDRRLCAPRGGQMLAAHQIRFTNRAWYGSKHVYLVSLVYFVYLVCRLALQSGRQMH